MYKRISLSWTSTIRWVVSAIPEEIGAKFIIGVFIAFKHVYIAEIQTTYNFANADRPAKTWELISVIWLLFNVLRKK
jgi:hypothetical protein